MTFTNAVYIVPLLCFMYSAIQAFSIDYSDTFFPSDFDGEGSAQNDLKLSMEKRQWTSSVCRRCMYRRDDWRSCLQCYNRPGAPIPFYGGFSKRSGNVLPGEQQMVPQTGDDNNVGFNAEKRTVVDFYCRCCMSSLNNNFCCSHCNLTPYYVSYGKRSYHTSFFPIGNSGVGMCEMCCDPATFDYYCCAISCGDKKRK